MKRFLLLFFFAAAAIEYADLNARKGVEMVVYKPIVRVCPVLVSPDRIEIE